MKRSTPSMPARSEKPRRAREIGLHIEGQLLVGPAGEEMEVAANGPEEILGAREQPIFLGAEHALADELGAGLHPVKILADPEQRVEVSEAPLPSLMLGSTT